MQNSCVYTSCENFCAAESWKPLGIAILSASLKSWFKLNPEQRLPDASRSSSWGIIRFSSLSCVCFWMVLWPRHDGVGSSHVSISPGLPQQVQSRVVVTQARAVGTKGWHLPKVGLSFVAWVHYWFTRSNSIQIQFKVFIVICTIRNMFSVMQWDSSIVFHILNAKK